MCIRTSSIIAAGCLVFMQPASADIIALKSGQKLEGKIIREEGGDYVVEVVVSGTIKDERRVPRDDVKSIDKELPDEKAFAMIGVPVPTPELLEKEAYEDWISELEGFLKTYPESSKAQTAKELLDTLGSEYDVIAAGGIKFGEEMVSAGDYEANAYEYDAKIAEKGIKDAVARRDFLGSLRMFGEYSDRFGDSEARPGMDALILQVLVAFKGSLDDSMASLDRRLEKRQAGLASMTPEDRVKTERALEDQMKKTDKRYQNEKAGGQKWVTPDSFHRDSMASVLLNVESEISRLRSQPEPLPLEVPLAKVYRDAWGTLADLDEDDASKPDASPGDDEEGKTDPTELTDEEKIKAEEEKRLADAAEEEARKLREQARIKVIEDAKSKRLPEYYLEKLRLRAGLGNN